MLHRCYFLSINFVVFFDRAIRIVNDAMIGAEKTIRAAEQEVQGAMAKAKGIRSIGQSKALSIQAESEAEELGTYMNMEKTFKTFLNLKFF